MSNSMFVPLLEMPPDIDTVASIIQSAFSEFQLCPPKIWVDSRSSPSTSVADGFIMIEGNQAGDECWVSLSTCSSELTGDDACSVLADVKTRGSWTFAAVVAYAFCKYSGRIIFNDAGELDGQESYSAASLGKLIQTMLRQGGPG